MSDRGRGVDRALGIALGLALGLAVVIGFVFLGSEQTVDAPRISGGGAGQHGAPTRSKPSRAIPVVRVIGGAPPPAGPRRLRFRPGRRARFIVATDAPVEIAVPGYLRRAVSGRELISFRPRGPGELPVVVASSHIAIASLRIGR